MPWLSEDPRPLTSSYALLKETPGKNKFQITVTPSISKKITPMITVKHPSHGLNRKFLRTTNPNVNLKRIILCKLYRGYCISLWAHPAKAPPRCAAQEVRIFTSFEIMSNVTMTSFITKAAIGKNLAIFSKFWLKFVLEGWKYRVSNENYSW